MAEGVIKHFGMLTKTINGTTDNTGDISLSLNTSSYLPIMFVRSLPNNIALAYTFLQDVVGNSWYLKVVGDNLTNWSSKAISGTLYYIKI